MCSGWTPPTRFPRSPSASQIRFPVVDQVRARDRAHGHPEALALNFYFDRILQALNQPEKEPLDPFLPTYQRCEALDKHLPTGEPRVVGRLDEGRSTPGDETSTMLCSGSSARSSR